jgi:hypothetical protein
MRPSTDLQPHKLRNLAAVLTALSGTGQCLALWLLPTTPMLLGTALMGSIYLVLALGLFGISRLSLFLAVILLPLRSWFGLLPLDIPTWEFLRVASDLAIALLCLPMLWTSLGHEHEKIEPGQRAALRHLDDGGSA